MFIRRKQIGVGAVERAGVGGIENVTMDHDETAGLLATRMKEANDRGTTPGSEDHPSRRQALLFGSALGAASMASFPATTDARAPGIKPSPATKSDVERRMPTVFLPHGGGPWPFVDLGFPKAEIEPLATYLRSLAMLPLSPPRAVLVISAHWEEKAPTVMTGEHPALLYDYSGFPPESYRLTWPAPGQPKLAARVRQLLESSGFASGDDGERGFDHGTFVPLKLMYPDARIPTVQLSLKRGLDPKEHLAMGRALAPLRDEGVYIVGSGMSYHNLRAMRDPSAVPAGQAFDTWLRATASLEPGARAHALGDWDKAPAARQAHPREEHLLPLMVVAGAAGNDRGTVGFSGRMFGLPISAFHFG